MLLVFLKLDVEFMWMYNAILLSRKTGLGAIIGTM